MRVCLWEAARGLLSAAASYAVIIPRCCYHTRVAATYSEAAHYHHYYHNHMMAALSLSVLVSLCFHRINSHMTTHTMMLLFTHTTDELVRKRAHATRVSGIDFAASFFSITRTYASAHVTLRPRC